MGMFIITYINIKKMEYFLATQFGLYFSVRLAISEKV